MSEALASHRAAHKATVQRLISRLLRVGVLTSMVLVVIGTTMTFLGHPRYVTNASSLAHLRHAPSSFPHTLSGVVDGVLAGSGPAVVMLGLMVLVITPVLRVAVSIALFAIERDRKFVVITSFVLLMLLASFVLGRASA
jgi:uncharacterized membrane protein